MKYKSLSKVKKADRVALDMHEVAADLTETVRNNYKVIDASIFELISAEPDLIAFLLNDEFPPHMVYNCLNSDFGKGILIGMLIEAISTYYAMLEQQVEGNIEDGFAIDSYDHGGGDPDGYN